MHPDLHIHPEADTSQRGAMPSQFVTLEPHAHVVAIPSGFGRTIAPMVVGRHVTSTQREDKRGESVRGGVGD